MADQSQTGTRDGKLNAEAQPFAEDSGHLQESLKDFGVDTERMIEATGERVDDLQQMLIDEVRARPLRALGWAAAVGLVAGFMAAR